MVAWLLGCPSQPLDLPKEKRRRRRRRKKRDHETSSGDCSDHTFYQRPTEPRFLSRDLPLSLPLTMWPPTHGCSLPTRVCTAQTRTLCDRGSWCTPTRRMPSGWSRSLSGRCTTRSGSSTSESDLPRAPCPMSMCPRVPAQRTLHRCRRDDAGCAALHVGVGGCVWVWCVSPLIFIWPLTTMPSRNGTQVHRRGQERSTPSAQKLTLLFLKVVVIVTNRWTRRPYDSETISCCNYQQWLSIDGVWADRQGGFPHFYCFKASNDSMRVVMLAG
jgi:hypothetical protein